MSRWCGKCDFRDTLSINFNDDFDEFLARTGGVIYQRKKEKTIEIKVQTPSDLIPYYAHIVTGMASSPKRCSITLSEESYLDTRIKELNAAMQEIGSRKELEEVIKYKKSRKTELLELYKKERKKPPFEQRIVDR